MSAAVSGWGAAGYLYFITIPNVADAHKVADTLDMVDRFGSSPAHDVYMQLGDDMKPWWDQIDEIQRQIAAATDDNVREKLIAQRDQTLITFIHDHALSNRIDLLINSFSQFDRCLNVDACDEEALRKSISIDVKRIYRTFRPYIESVRTSGVPGKDQVRQRTGRSLLPLRRVRHGRRLCRREKAPAELFQCRTRGDFIAGPGANDRSVTAWSQ